MLREGEYPEIHDIYFGTQNSGVSNGEDLQSIGTLHSSSTAMYTQAVRPGGLSSMVNHALCVHCPEPICFAVTPHAAA